MNLIHEIIEIGRYLTKQKSQCKYTDYFNVFKARNPDRVWVWQKKDIPRLMRKLRERGVFKPIKRTFHLSDKLMGVV